jgi:hypothetical protein
MMVFRHAEQINNCEAARKYSVSEANVRRWKQEKQKLTNVNSTRKSFSGPKHGRFHEAEEQVVQSVRIRRQNGIPVLCDIIKLRAREVAKMLPVNTVYQEFKASTGCVRIMLRNGVSFRRRTTLCQKLPSHFEEKLLTFQKHAIGLRKANNYILSQIGNAGETPVYSDMSSNYTVDTGVKSVLIKTSGNEKLVTVMLTVLADGTKLPPYVVLNRKTMPKEQLPNSRIVRCQSNGWMTNELMTDWLQVVRNRRPRVLLRK